MIRNRTLPSFVRLGLSPWDGRMPIPNGGGGLPLPPAVPVFPGGGPPLPEPPMPPPLPDFPPVIPPDLFPPGGFPPGPPPEEEPPVEEPPVEEEAPSTQTIIIRQPYAPAYWYYPYATRPAVQAQAAAPDWLPWAALAAATLAIGIAIA